MRCACFVQQTSTQNLELGMLVVGAVEEGRIRAAQAAKAAQARKQNAGFSVVVRLQELATLEQLWDPSIELGFSGPRKQRKARQQRAMDSNQAFMMRDVGID